MKRVSIGRIAFLLLYFAPWCAAQSGLPLNCVEGFKIREVKRTGLPASIRVPIAVGDLVSVDQMARAKEELTKELHQKVWDVDSVSYRFALHEADIICLAPDNANTTVEVELRADNVGIPEGDSVGSVIDEADTDRLFRMRNQLGAGLKMNYDPVLGGMAGFAVQDLDWLEPEGKLANRDRYRLEGWKTFAGPEYSLLASGEFNSWKLTNPRGSHGLANVSAWIQRIPIAEGRMRSRGVSLGYGWESQAGNTDFRMTFAYRFASIHADGSPNARKTHTAEGKISQEYSTHGGFVRLGGWADYGKATRLAAFTRYYQHLNLARSLSATAEITVSVGRAFGILPVERRFVGGTRLDPFLGDKEHNRDEFTWMGPIVRGYGVAGFNIPQQFFKPSGAPGFSGVSVTLGLPSFFSKPLFEAVDVSQRSVVQEKIQNAFDLAVASLVRQNIENGSSATDATKRSRKEAAELRQALHNVLRHGNRISVRPIALFDAGWITDHGVNRTGLNAGLGLRIQSPKAGIEALYVRTVRDTLPASRLGEEFFVRFYLRQIRD